MGGARWVLGKSARCGIEIVCSECIYSHKSTDLSATAAVLLLDGRPHLLFHPCDGADASIHHGSVDLADA